MAKDTKEKQAQPPRLFDMSNYTPAKLQMWMTIDFERMTAAEVFDVMGDPKRIKDWYLLVKDVLIHPPGPGGDVNFDVEFTFFGEVREDILHWDVPTRYVYKASGRDFPIKDYVALIEIERTGEKSGSMHWLTYFDIIEGEHFQRILPAMLPAINAASLQKLATLIGGTKVRTENYM